MTTSLPSLSLLETVDVSEESKPEPAKRRTTSRRVVKKKVTISADDNIIHDPDVALKLGKSISITEAKEEEAARQVHATHARIVTESIPEPAKKKTGSRSTKSVVIQNTPSAPQSKPSDLKPKLKGVQSLTSEEQEAADVMQALKGVRKLAEDSQVLEAQVKELVGYQGFPISPQSSLLPQVKELIDSEEDDEKKDDTDDYKSTDLEMTDDEETDDEVLQGKEQVKNDEDEEMTNAEVKGSGNGIEEDTDAAKADAEKIKEAKDDFNKVELPPTSSSLSISSVAPITTLPPPSVSTIPPLPLQQTTAPIPPPPITTDALTITTAVPESNALPVVQLRVEKLEKDVSKLKKIDHSTKALATLKSQVPTVVEQYLGSKIDDDLQKVIQRHTAYLIQKYSMKLAPESSKIQTPTINLE
ncbi:hypothetical protein Tco_1492260 [Tanacetum coccineum]